MTTCFAAASCVIALAGAALLPAPVKAESDESPDAVTGKEWIDMNYGPFLTTATEIAKGNIAYKGISIRLDQGEGGVSAGNEFMLFDTDTLRYAAGWVGPQFLNWRSIVYDGSHQTHVAIRGQTVFSNPVGPGWGRPKDGSFEDRRVLGRDGRRYGPLQPDWGRWKGLYLHGDRVVLSYTVGDAEVLELPGVERWEDATALVRTLNIGPRPRGLILQVAHQAGNKPVLRNVGDRQIAVFVQKAPQPGESATRAGLLAFDGSSSLEVTGSTAFDFTGKSFTITARIKTTEGGTIVSKAPPHGEWVPNGKTFFVRGGQLGYDIGWVGVVQGRQRVDDGKWHQVAVSFDAETDLVRLYVDGDPDGRKKLTPRAPVTGHVVKLGFTSPNFPNPSALQGELDDVRFYQRALTAEQIGSLSELANENDSLVARWIVSGATGPALADASGNRHTARRTAVENTDGPSRLPGMNTVPAIALAGTTMGTAWLALDDGNLRLTVSAGPEPVRLKVLYGLIADNDAVEPFAALVQASCVPMDLEPLTHGGPPRWREKITTKVMALGPSDGPYVVETIVPPMKNPYRSWMRLGAFDFFPGGKRAAVCTWMGDVWIVDGLGGEQLDEFTWQRIATGLYQPLGLKIAGDTIYVLGRDQITRLHDLNGDGEADFYENFNNDHQVTEHFHEFASGLETDAEGNFYYMKGGRHALDAVVPQHGSLLKVSEDGRRTEKVAYGFRAPNGLSITPNGSFLISDQEGHWTPANRINLVKPGGYYGYGWAYHDSGAAPVTYVPPLCWIPPQMDRSPAEQLFVTSKKWGPFEGRILSLSYGTGNISLVLHEQVGDRVQGGLLYMPIAVFPTGIMRARFNSIDGQLYACGLFGWSSNRTRPGGFYRIRYTGRKVYMPSALHAIERGMVLEFTEPLDPRRAGRPGAYKVERWEYRRSANYGSKDYRLSDGSEGRDALTVESVQVSEDGKSVLLEIPDMKPCMQMRIRYRLQAADGARLSHEIYNTIHALGDDAPYRERFPRLGG